MVNSLRISFLTRKDADSDSPNATIVKPSHHSGIRHQSGYTCGEKLVMRLPTTSKGKAMSMASDCRKASVSDGTRFLPIIQNPRRPMPRSASTACRVIRKMLTLFPSYMSLGTLADCSDGLRRVLSPGCFQTESGCVTANAQIVTVRRSGHWTLEKAVNQFTTRATRPNSPMVRGAGEMC
jgi:hypothetical protein